MTEVMNTCDSAVGGASTDDVMAFQVERFLPSIVVVPTDGDQVESGELRWPPDDVSSDVTEGHAPLTDVPVEEAEPEEQVMGGV